MLKASAFEFRMRYVLHLLVFFLGFATPWDRITPLDPSGPNAHVWGLLAANLAQVGVAGLLTAFNLLLVVGIVLALAAAALRTWGTAYLGAAVVKSGAMQSAGETVPGLGVITDGPFRFLRNPLYVGTFLHALALSLLMPRSGAIFSIVAIGLLQVRLVLGEEAFLTERLGASYLAYCRLVPRFLPKLRPAVAASGRRPQWAQAFVGELYFWVVALAFAALGWRYNASLLIQGVIVAIGASIVARAVMPGHRVPANS